MQPGGRKPPTEESPDVDRAEKKAAIETLNGVFKASNVVVVAHYSGLTVAQMQQLRKQMRAAGASVKVAKNRLAKIALEGTDVASIGPLLKGPTVIAYSSDVIAAPKVATDFAKANEKFVILGGAMGKTALDPERREGTRLAAVARRTARQAGRPSGRAGHQDRAARERSGRQGRARHPGLCLEGRSRVRLPVINHWFEPDKRKTEKWLT